MIETGKTNMRFDESENNGERVITSQNMKKQFSDIFTEKINKEELRTFSFQMKKNEKEKIEMKKNENLFDIYIKAIRKNIRPYDAIPILALR